MSTDSPESACIGRELRAHSEGEDCCFVSSVEVAETWGEGPPLSLLKLSEPSSSQTVSPVLNSMERSDSEVEEVD